MGARLLITIITLVGLDIRWARPMVSENPAIIQDPRECHFTLAPHSILHKLSSREFPGFLSNCIRPKEITQISILKRAIQRCFFQVRVFNGNLIARRAFVFSGGQTQAVAA
jgi:hypothetical protein